MIYGNELFTQKKEKKMSHGMFIKHKFRCFNYTYCTVAHEC